MREIQCSDSMTRKLIAFYYQSLAVCMASYQRIYWSIKKQSEQSNRYHIDCIVRLFLYLSRLQYIYSSIFKYHGKSKHDCLENMNGRDIFLENTLAPSLHICWVNSYKGVSGNNPIIRCLKVQCTQRKCAQIQPSPDSCNHIKPHVQENLITKFLPIKEVNQILKTPGDSTC